VIKFSILYADKEDKMPLTMDLKDIKIKGDRVLVKQIKFEEKIGSFVIPENVRDRKAKRRADAWKAQVVTIGDKVYFENHHWGFKEGDVVFCAPVSLDCPSFEAENGDVYKIILQEDCLAVVTDKENK